MERRANFLRPAKPSRGEFVKAIAGGAALAAPMILGAAEKGSGRQFKSAYTGKQVFWDEMMTDPKKKPAVYNLTLKPTAEDFEKGTVEIPKENVVAVPGTTG